MPITIASKDIIKLAITFSVVLVFVLMSRDPVAAEETCYQVTAAKSLYVREKSNRYGKIITAVPHGKILKKVGVPFCGIWWCKIELGSHKGYASKNYLKKINCP